jgi:hypothetical protein
MFGLLLAGCGKDADTGSDETTGAEVQVGDIVVIEGTGYEWLVLDVKADQMLIITKDIIELKAYNEMEEDVTWETCSLRRWLNDELYNEAFYEVRAYISPTRLTTEDNPNYDTVGGNDTEDYIFCLSLSEAEKYFASDKERVASFYPTDEQLKAIGQSVAGNPLYEFATAEEATADFKAYISSSPAFYWWLRTPGDSQRRMVCVSNIGNMKGYDGSEASGGLVYDPAIGVRPAMWVDVQILADEKAGAEA